MKMKLIIYGLMLISITYLMGDNSLTAPESTTALFLSIIVVLVLLLLLLAYQTQKDMAKIQKTLDNLIFDLKYAREALDDKNDPLRPEQHATRDEVEETLWDELDQADKDAHIAKIRKSMEYTGSSSNNSGQGNRNSDSYGSIQIEAYYEMSGDTVGV